MFREALAMRHRLLGGAHPDIARTVHNLADVLQRRSDFAGIQALFGDELTNAVNRFDSDPVYQILDAMLARDEATRVDQLMSELLTPAIRKQPKNVGLLRDRGEFLARRGRWNEAAPDLAEVIELDPVTHDPWDFLASLLLRNGATNEYRRHCHEMLLRFGETSHPVVAERTAKACLLLPVSGSDFALATELAQTAVLAGLDHPFTDYYQFVKGLAEYRLGHFVLAQNSLRKSLTCGERGHLGIRARLVLAMTCQHQEKTNEARYAFLDAFAAAAEAMRRILVDNARMKRSHRHGGGCQRVAMPEIASAVAEDDGQILAVNEALEQFAAQDKQKAELVKLRYFVGMTLEEAAEALGISVPTAKRHWAYARAWLAKEIGSPKSQ